jgi:hypothetical protein
VKGYDLGKTDPVSLLKRLHSLKQMPKILSELLGKPALWKKACFRNLSGKNFYHIRDYVDAHHLFPGNELFLL